MVDTIRQYGSALPYADKLSVNVANAVSEFDKARIRTYTLYEDFYNNQPDAFKVILRGEDSEQHQIYVPSSEKIIEAICRYHAVNVGYELNQTDPTADKLMTDLWDRETFSLKHTANKRWGCVRGDSAFYITADRSKKRGERISIHDLDPSNYFPITDRVDGKLIGAYIVDTYPHPDPDKSELAARRQMYLRERNPQTGAFSGKIIYDSRLFTLGKWDSRQDRPPVELLKTLVEPQYLPPQITSIPIYMIPNGAVLRQDSIFGRSELAGIETLVAAINQTMTDQDISLAIAGLGMYTTNAPPEKDAAGNPLPWAFGPARMLELPAGDGKNTYSINRIQGINSITPMVDHIDKADQFMQQGKGISEIAVGKADVSVAESGIALRLQLAPILAKGEEKQAIRAAKQNQMWYDILHQWFPAYEEHTPAAELRCLTTYGDPVPVNEQDVFDNHLALFNLGVYPVAKFYEAVNKLNFGFDLQPGDFEKAQEERKQMTEAASPPDPLGERMANEFNSGGAGDDTVEVTT